MSKPFKSLDSSQKCTENLEDQLYLAINRDDIESIHSSLQRGALVTAVCSRGWTALGAAAYKGNVEILKIILSSSFNAIKNIHDKENKESSKGMNSTKCSVPRKWLHKSGNNHKTTTGKEEIEEEYQQNSSDDDKNSELNLIDRRSNGCRYTYKGSCKDISCNKTEDRKGCRNSILKEEECVDSSLTPSSCTTLIECQKEKEIISERKQDTNQGYYIVIHQDYIDEEKHEDDSSKWNVDENLNEAQTPDGMNELEWDLELIQEESKFISDDEESSWMNVYRWHADYLAKTSSLTHSPCDVNQLDAHGRGAMHYAAEQGNVEVLNVLLKAGCLVNIGDPDDVTPLHLAAARDHPDAVLLLINSGATVDQRSIERTGPLHMAAARGFIETARILLEHGANVNALDRGDRTPLMLAVSRGLKDMVRLLLNHGAKVNVEDIHGYTPLCQAVWLHEKDLVCTLLKAGAKLTQSDKLLHYAVLHRQVDIAELLIRAGSIINLRDDHGDTPLIIAAKSAQVDMVQLLLKNGALANYPNGLTGSTALHEAVQYLRPVQHSHLKDIIIALLHYGGNINFLTTRLDTPLTRAFIHDNEHAMVMLIQFGANVNILQEHTPVVSPAYLQRRPDRYALAHLMIHAGLDLWYFTQEIKFGDKNPPDSPSSWISEIKFNPMSLAAQIRVQFRRFYGNQVYRILNQMNWPSKLKQYIMFQEYAHCIK